MASPRREDGKKTKDMERKMTAVEKLDVGLFASLLLIVLPAIFVAAHLLLG